MAGIGTLSPPSLYRTRDVMEDRAIDYDGVRIHTDIRWFELLEGEKRGLQFAIPVKHPEYDTGMQEQLTGLSEGDVIEMKLKSVNERCTAWICHGLDVDASLADRFDGFDPQE